MDEFIDFCEKSARKLSEWQERMPTPSLRAECVFLAADFRRIAKALKEKKNDEKRNDKH